ncbi:MAG: acyltransferase [Edaphocola sp.]
MVNFNVTPRNLKGWSSYYLDVVRITAAFIVLVAHALATSNRAFESNIFVAHLSHNAVVVFFVLSGFVISHTTYSTKRNAIEYFAARYGRLYSIMFAAVLLTVLCYLLGKGVHAPTISEYDQGNFATRALLSLFYLNEIWFLSAAPLINGPLWSLGYEFWYYIIFGLYTYRNNQKYTTLLLLMALLFVGPKILVMMLIWLLGFVAYRANTKYRNIKNRRLIAIALVAISYVLALYMPAFPHKMGSAPLYWASQYITDIFIGLFVALAFAFLPTNQEPAVPAKTKANKFVKWLSAMTFPLYVFHFPLLVLGKCFLQRLHATNVINIYYWAMTIIVFVIAIALGHFLEKRKGWWDSFFALLFGKVRTKVKMVERK